MKVSANFLCLLLAFTAVCGAANAQEYRWYKGNLHTHSYWSDGDDYPEMIMKWYKMHGYDFVALSDHNILAEGDKWVKVQKGSSHEKTFREYLNAYGKKWVEYDEHETHYRVKLKTLEEYRPLFEEEGIFRVIKSQEITDGFKDKPIHVNATNIQQLVKPQGGHSIASVMQNNIDAVLEQRQATGEPMFPHINHPNFGWAVTAEDLKKLEGERFFEVYNGHPLVHNEGDSLRSGTEQMWDEVNTYYLVHGKPVMYGIAVDDAHNYQQFDTTRSNPGRGWIHVKSSSLTPDSLIAAMERGNFYASTGVKLEIVQFDGQTLSIEIKPEKGVQYTTKFIGALSDPKSEEATLLSTVKGTSVTYTLSGNEMYVRAKIISDKPKQNPYAKGEVEVAWTQPVVNKRIKR